MGSSCSAPARQRSGGAEHYAIAFEQAAGGRQRSHHPLQQQTQAQQEAIHSPSLDALRRVSSLSTTTVATIATPPSTGANVVVGNADTPGHPHPQSRAAAGHTNVTTTTDNGHLHAIDRLLLESTTASVLSSDGVVSTTATTRSTPQHATKHTTPQRQHASHHNAVTDVSSANAAGGLSFSAATTSHGQHQHHRCLTPKLIASSFASTVVLNACDDDDFALSPATAAATAAAAAAALPPPSSKGSTTAQPFDIVTTLRDGGCRNAASIECPPQLDVATMTSGQQPHKQKHQGNDQPQRHLHALHSDDISTTQNGRTMTWSMLNATSTDIGQWTEGSPTSSTTSSDADNGAPASAEVRRGKAPQPSSFVFPQTTLRASNR